MNINEVIINNRVSRYFVGTLTNLQFYMKLRAFVRSVVKPFVIKHSILWKRVNTMNFIVHVERKLLAKI